MSTEVTGCFCHGAIGPPSFVSDAGVVYFPASVFMNDVETLFLCSHDGIEMIRHEDEIYVPAYWLAIEFPKFAEDIQNAVTNTLQSWKKHREGEEGNDQAQSGLQMKIEEKMELYKTLEDIQNRITKIEEDVKLIPAQTIGEINMRLGGVQERIDAAINRLVRTRGL